ncbi:MAG TPA: rhomboid family intramembrane serine protease [Lacipirellulaceae bacterium]
MLFPYSTDAPVYHWPIATVGLIFANTLILVAMATGHLYVDDWILEYGHGLHPQQWLSSIFAHAGWEHLIANMIFLWIFGLVVEGKLGWWRFLACYLAIGITETMLEQLIMLHYHGDVPGSLGASGAIFGIMAMAAVWAPKNEVSIWYLFFIRPGTFEISILTLVGLYTGLQCLMLLISGGTEGSSWLHVGGFALGLIPAIVLLKSGLVDCEDWDFFHVWSGNYGGFHEKPTPPDNSAELDARRQERDAKLLADGQTQLASYLDAGNVNAAFVLYQKIKHVGSGLALDRGQLRAMIKGLQVAGRWHESAPFMAEFIARFPDTAEPMRLKLAQICVVELQRPGKAIDILKAINARRLPPDQLALAKKIAAKAEQMQAEGVVELDSEHW